jgi:hypothetical protein
MCTADAAHAGGDAFGPAAGRGFGSASQALALADAAMDYVNAGVAALNGTACGDLLIALGEVQAKLTAAHAGLLRRFDAADAHDADGYGSSSSWLAAKGGMSKHAARAAVRQMRQLGERPLLGNALAAGDITDSIAFVIAGWTRKLPAQMRDETDRILLEAATAGRPLTTWPQSPPARSRPGARSSPTPTTLTPATGTSSSASRSAAPPSSAATSPPNVPPRSAPSLRRSARKPAKKTTAPRASGSTTRCSWPAPCC